MWDRRDYWQDPTYFPKIKYEPVSSVPYWDDRCGMKFSEIDEFNSCLTDFINETTKQSFRPREYILENLTLAKSATEYLSIFEEVKKEL